MENEKILMLDSETTNDIECPLVYDIGFAVVDIYGNTYEEGSFVVADIFLDKELMSTAFLPIRYLPIGKILKAVSVCFVDIKQYASLLPML